MNEKTKNGGNVILEVEEAEKLFGNIESDMAVSITQDLGTFYTLLCC